jgi:putative tryptophan/tyrosine transport system substrate-binding protein
MNMVSCKSSLVRRKGGAKTATGKIFVWLLATFFLTTVFPAEAQQRKKVPRIGMLFPASPSPAAPFIDAFRQGLHDLGYIEGKQIIIEYRFTEGKQDRLPDLAADLVRLNVDIIVVGGGSATLAAKKATRTVPIVMASAGDPVGTGIVASLARPGGNITGLTLISPDLSGKSLELLKETIPGLNRVALLTHPSDTSTALMLKETETAAQSLGLQLQILEAGGPEQLENVFGIAKKRGSEAINVLTSAFFGNQRKKIVELVTRTHLPAMYFDRQFVDSGGLMSYGANVAELFRRAATYVDKILKGAKPADLPVEQPTRFEFVINLKAAKQIGLTIPPNMLARADKVIR